jgi:hypothetical protein
MRHIYQDAATDMEGSHTMGDKGGKKDKDKGQKQKLVKEKKNTKKKQDKQQKRTP